MVSSSPARTGQTLTILSLFLSLSLSLSLSLFLSLWGRALTIFTLSLSLALCFSLSGRARTIEELRPRRLAAPLLLLAARLRPELASQ